MTSPPLPAVLTGWWLHAAGHASLERVSSAAADLWRSITVVSLGALDLDPLALVDETDWRRVRELMPDRPDLIDELVATGLLRELGSLYEVAGSPTAHVVEFLASFDLDVEVVDRLDLEVRPAPDGGWLCRGLPSTPGGRRCHGHTDNGRAWR